MLEKFVKFLITLSTITAVLLVLVIIAVIVHYLKTQSTTEKLLNNGKRDGNFVYNLLRTYFSRGHIFKRVLIPSLPSKGNAAALPTDIILVERGGIFVIKTINASGAIDNSNPASWFIHNSKGVYEIPNPFEKNHLTLRSIKEILRREKIYNIPLHSVVVFTGRKVVFKKRFEKLLTAERLVPVLSDMNKNKFLSQNEISGVILAIKKYLPRPSGQQQI